MYIVCLKMARAFTLLGVWTTFISAFTPKSANSTEFKGKGYTLNSATQQFANLHRSQKYVYIDTAVGTLMNHKRKNLSSQ